MTIPNDSSRHEKTILVPQSFDALRLNRVVANWRYRVM